DEYGYLDIFVDYKKLLKKYFIELENKTAWKHIFSKYLIEFENSKQYKTTIDSKKVSLDNAILNYDGSISINNKKVFSLR
ncbi:MAG: biotin--[acetyl-CoA-carboxylase] ligase, partial [Campylobacterota bacterium]|nr:biotin--[acetyl-CoA-carboxylase] ligase [Campylobacterota bacterium]